MTRRLPEPVDDAVRWLNEAGRSMVADQLANWARDEFERCERELNAARELLRQARGWLGDWRAKLDHAGFQNATHIMTLEGVTKMIQRLEAFISKGENHVR